MIDFYLRVGDSFTLLDLSDVALSLRYDLTNEDDPSSFTTVYSSSIDIPLSAGNRVAFGFPDIVCKSISSYRYDIYRDGLLIDSGVLVVDSVYDLYLTCNLFSDVVSLSNTLSSCKSLSDFCYDGKGVSKVNASVKDLTTKVQLYASKFRGINSAFGITHNEVLGYPSDFLYFYVANIGKPKDFDCSHLYNSDGSISDIGYDALWCQVVEYSSELNSLVHQLRWYQLQPVVPLDVIFGNACRYASYKGYSLSLSDSIKNLISGIGYTIPKVKDFNDLGYSWVDGTDTLKRRIVSKFSAGFHARISMNVDEYRRKTIETVSGKTDGIYLYFTISQRVGTTTQMHTILMCPEGYDQSLFGMLYPDVLYDEWVYWNNDFEVKISDWVAEGTYVVSVDTYHCIKVDGGSYEKAIKYNMVEYPYYYFRPLESLPAYQIQFYIDGCSLSILDWMGVVSDPWSIIRKVCKKYNIRLRQDDFRSYTFCSTVEYYYSSFNDLTSFIDYKDSYQNAYYYKSKLFQFSDECVETAWMKQYKDKVGVEYGSAKVQTSYPVDSESEWFSDKIKCIHTPYHFVYNTIKVDGVSKQDDIETIAEAYDSDYNEVSINGCLVSIVYDLNHEGIYLWNDFVLEGQSQCYYGQGSSLPSLSTFNKLSTVKFTSTSLGKGRGTELFMYGQSKYNPLDTDIQDNIHKYFGDVLDTFNSKVFHCKVDLYHLNMRLYDFVRYVHYFDNAYWVVSRVLGYDLVNPRFSEVEFLKVNDVNNYKIENKFMVTINSVNGTVNGGGQYPEGTSVTLTFVPSAHYHFTQWGDGNTSNPRTVVVDSDISLSVTGVVDTYNVRATMDHGRVIVTDHNTGEVVDISQPIAYGRDLDFEAQADPGYEFYEWDDGFMAQVREEVIESDLVLHATTTDNRPQVNYTCTNGSVGVYNTTTTELISSGDYVDVGTSVTYEIEPNEHYEYTGTNPLVEVVNTTVNHNFVCTQIMHNLQVSSTNGDVSFNPSPSSEFE